MRVWTVGHSTHVADHRVLTEGAQHQRIVGVSVAGVGGEQQLFLEPEVHTPMAGPVRDERLAGLGGGRIRRATESLGHHERLVMVARERSECG